MWSISESKFGTKTLLGLPFLTGIITAAAFLVLFHGLSGMRTLDPSEIAVALFSCGLMSAFGARKMTRKERKQHEEGQT
jgi:hypothetical protein